MNEFLQQFKEQVGRIWGQLNPQQKVLFVATPVLLLITMILAVYLASRPQWVTLITSEDMAQLQQITTNLDSTGIKYEAGMNYIKVDKKDRARAALQLAGENLLSRDFGPGAELFDETRLGMTERMFDFQSKRALENELAKMIAESPTIQNALVKLNIPKPALFKEDRTAPSASVKVISRGNLTKKDVEGIQRLVAYSIEKLEPNSVVVVDERNRIISEESDANSNVLRTSKQLEYQLEYENILRQKLDQQLERIVGPDNYQVQVTAKMDWTEKSQMSINILSDNQAPISEKTYEEISKTQGIAGPPGISSNVQDTGIGAEGEQENSSITETITNYQYPWDKIETKNGVGDAKEITVSVLINYVENENGEKVAFDPDRLTQIETTLRSALNIPSTQLEFTLTQLPFDESLEKQLAREQMWSNTQTALSSLLPLLLLLVLAYFAYTFFQRAFAAKEVEHEISEEEVPIEPVTEARELSLSQLGLSEFGDIASLPAEEQRRLKMQEHVINYASEKPEEVAAIIKAWLSG
ncbi:MAG: flagellar basal-body MS-ring/collar protein FliF [bacterium]|jgi:flagellar M-ring protein FliF|nr:flagellar basal-body MS-ring/collar protein FliF [bacterium]